MKREMYNNNFEKATQTKHKIAQEKQQQLEGLKEVLEDYKSLLLKANNLIDEFHLDNNPILYSILLDKLLYKGCFSIDNSFKVEMNDFPYENSSSLGLNIVLGNGCCRHVASFYDDLYKDRFKTYFIPCYLSSVNFKHIAHKRKANHAINLIEYGDNVIGYDVLNSSVSYAINSHQLKSTSFYQMQYLTYKPACDYIFTDKSLTDIMTLLGKIKQSAKNKKRVISSYDLLSMREDIDTLLSSNENLLKDFKIVTNRDKENIVKGIQKIKTDK